MKVRKEVGRGRRVLTNGQDEHIVRAIGLCTLDVRKKCRKDALTLPLLSDRSKTRVTLYVTTQQTSRQRHSRLPLCLGDSSFLITPCTHYLVQAKRKRATGKESRSNHGRHSNSQTRTREYPSIGPEPHSRASAPPRCGLDAN
jgi:hypothetical protein